MAMDYLQKFKEETCELFVGGGWRIYVLERALRNTKFELFQRFGEELHQTVLELGKECMRTITSPESSPFISELLGQVLANQSRREMCRELTCPICEDGSTFESHQEFSHPIKSSAELLARVERLMLHILYCQNSQPSRVDAERSRTILCLDWVKEDAISTCKDHRLYDYMPGFTQASPIFIPNALCPDIEANTLLPDFDCLGRTWLHQSLEITTNPNNKSWIQGLLQKVKNAEKMDEQDLLGRTLLHIAVQNGYSEVVTQLINMGADVEAETILGATSLHYAAAKGSLEICRMLLLKSEINPNRLDKLGNTPLFYAVRKRNIDVVRLFLSSRLLGINPDVCSTPERCPLMEAITRNYKEIVQVLLESDVMMGITYLGNTPLHYAIQEEKTDIASVLIMEFQSRGSHHLMNRRNWQGKTPFALAAEKGLVDIIFDLVTSGDLDIDAQDNEGRTAFMLAARAGHYDMVVYMLQFCKIDLSQTDSEGLTAIELAREGEHGKIVELLERNVQ